jgi:sugar phosphate isomerase/epimerase
MPKLAVFPKAYVDALCLDGSMSLDQWIDMAAQLEIPGLEFYCEMLDLKKEQACQRYRKRAEDLGMSIPMFCCSPDFTHADRQFRARQVDQQKRWIEMTAELGGKYCRVLSGQYRPELSVETGLQLASECIIACHDTAKNLGITLILENHYKDNYWEYPEFAQKSDLFCKLVDMVDPTEHTHFGVNFDPSNTILAGEDPLELLRRVKNHVVTMHASDRYLKYGTLEDLQKEENSIGYAKRLCHGEIGQGMIDYDAIFAELRLVGFNGWISIEDGVDGFEQLQRSVAFLKQKIEQVWGTEL